MEANDASFIGCLALYQNRRDAAIGLHHITAKQRHLIAYYNYLQQKSYKELVTNSFYLGVVKSIRKRMRQIKKQITLETPLEQAQALYKEYAILQSQFDKSVEAING